MKAIHLYEKPVIVRLFLIHLILVIAKRIKSLGFGIVATSGSGQFLKENGVESEFVFKVKEGRPNLVDFLKNGEVTLLLNTPIGRESHLMRELLVR